MGGSEGNDCVEMVTIDPPTGEDDELNSKLFHVDCWFTFKKVYANWMRQNVFLGVMTL